MDKCLQYYIFPYRLSPMNPPTPNRHDMFVSMCITLGGIVVAVGVVSCCATLPDQGQELSRGDVWYEIM